MPIVILNGIKSLDEVQYEGWPVLGYSVLWFGRGYSHSEELFGVGIYLGWWNGF